MPASREQNSFDLCEEETPHLPLGTEVPIQKTLHGFHMLHSLDPNPVFIKNSHHASTIYKFSALQSY